MAAAPNLQFYTDMTVAYPQGAPPWIKPGSQWSGDTLFTTVDGMPAVHYINQTAFSCTPLQTGSGRQREATNARSAPTSAGVLVGVRM